MSGVSKLSFYLSKGRVADAIASVQAYPTVMAQGASDCNRSKCFGLVLHVSKGKKISVVKTSGDAKRTRTEVSYFRLVFLR